jgi:hypothetical protein
MKRKFVLAMSFFVIVGTAMAAGRSPSPFALKLKAFQSGFRNCSRPTPSGMTSFWQVNEGDVKTIDQALMQYLDLTAITKRLSKPPSAYGRQYLGFNRGTRRFIYINAYVKAPKSAKSTFVRACDGGNKFWGIEYDLQQKLFRDFELNSVPGAGDPLDGLKL